MLPRLLDSRLDLVLLAKLTLVATSGVVRDGDSVRDTALPPRKSNPHLQTVGLILQAVHTRKTPAYKLSYEP